VNPRIKIYRWHPSEWIADVYLSRGHRVTYSRFGTWREALAWGNAALTQISHSRPLYDQLTGAVD
jgi:hypothetical protein